MKQAGKPGNISAKNQWLIGPKTGSRTPDIFASRYWAEIERRTDILALSAFLLALAGVAYQLFSFSKGPVVRLFEPELLLINFENYGKEKRFVRINAPMAYVNLGDPGYNATIRKERVAFELSDLFLAQFDLAVDVVKVD